MKLELSNLAGRIRLIGVLLVHRIVLALARVRGLGPLLVAGFVVALARVRQLGSFLVSRVAVELARAWQGLSMAVAELARLRRDGPRLLWRAVPTLTAIALLVASMGGRWRLASASPKGTLAQVSTVPDGPVTHPRSSKASGPRGKRSSSVAPQSGPHAGSNSVTAADRTTGAGAVADAVTDAGAVAGAGPAAGPGAVTGAGITTTARVATVASPSGGVDGFEDGAAPQRPVKKSRRELSGKLNLNSATEDQLMLLPTVGPAKAERIVTWRKKNGGFRRTADLRRVKGFGYKTFKRLQPFLDIEGDTSLH